MTHDEKDQKSDLSRLNDNIKKIEELNARLLAALQTRGYHDRGLHGPSPALYAKASAALMAEMLTNPAKMFEHQAGYWGKSLKHWIEAQQALSFTRQIIDMMAPTNFLATNPDALEKAIETEGQPGRRAGEPRARSRGEQRRAGGHGWPMTRRSRWARTSRPPKASVVYRNRMMELIQYAPTTEKVHAHAAADLPALDQQVLHPRPQGTEQPDQVDRRAGLHAVRGQLGQPRRQLSPMSAWTTTSRMAT
jgi:hypothetical protein